MPELPEVEVVRIGLAEILKDQPALQRIELKRKDLRGPIPVKKVLSLVGQKITSVERRAKYLLIWTPQGGFLSHLGMTGTWRVSPLGDERNHDHIYLYFSGNLRLAYRDPRRFGSFDFIEQPMQQHPKLKDLGPEPLDSDFTGTLLWRSLSNKSVPIKVALMDQKVVVGVGNIYASEALFAAKISPKTQAKKVSQKKAEELVLQIKNILSSAIKKGGSSISDFAQASGESGYFQNSFCVYGRVNEPCLICGHEIKSQTLAGRNTFWCSQCQK